MKKRMQGILDEIKRIDAKNNKDYFIENKVDTIVTSTTNLLKHISEKYDDETTKYLTNKLLNAIRTGDANKFYRSLRKFSKNKKTNLNVTEKTPEVTHKKKQSNKNNVGFIHKSEVKPTLEQLERDLKINLQNNVLGSAGKWNFSKDINIVVGISPKRIKEFRETVKSSSLVSATSESKYAVLGSRVQIQNFDNTIKTDKHRNGYVRVEFILDENVDWIKTFYHSPKEGESKYNGSYRNIAIDIISHLVDRKERTVVDQNETFLEIERYMYSGKHGLIRVMRRRLQNPTEKSSTNAWSSKIIGGPYKKKDEIINKLQMEETIFDSFEEVLKAVEKNHPTLIEIFARTFARDKTVQHKGIPEEINRYLVNK